MGDMGNMGDMGDMCGVSRDETCPAYSWRFAKPRIPEHRTKNIEQRTKNKEYVFN